ncbi:MAG TPA: deaminase [Solirubrobacterales bacterium]
MADMDVNSIEIPPPVLTGEEAESAARRAGTFVIGLTGPFGSGCTTAARLLETGDPPFTVIRLSDVLREIGGPELDRGQLQDLGNRLRRGEGNEALVVRGLGGLLDAQPALERVAIDGLRNLGEIRWLQKALGDRFSLFAVLAEIPERFDRQNTDMSPQQFNELDQRDQGEDEDFGQQVNRCVDFADVLINNGEQLPEWRIDRDLAAKVRGYADLVQGASPRYPTREEQLMNVAYASSHGSRCLKRQVGCVIGEGDEPLASGYNENPDGLRPCIDEFETCFRDIVRHERFVELSQLGTRCPFCTHPIPRPLPHPWDCPNCGKSLDAAFFPDRAMKWCTALHAEERALLNAGARDLSATTLYSTTFPCMLCAEKIIQAGIRDVVFIEAYPDAHGQILFKAAGVQVRRFEGVRSRNFQQYFGETQSKMEEQGMERLRQMAGLA